jgi:acetyl esterase/lipase
LRQFSLEDMPGVEPVDLTAEGRVRVEERQVPGPQGAPEITVLILSPIQASGAKAGIYHTHGGGMVSGNRPIHPVSAR